MHTFSGAHRQVAVFLGEIGAAPLLGGLPEAKHWESVGTTALLARKGLVAGLATNIICSFGDPQLDASVSEPTHGFESLPHRQLSCSIH